MRRQSNRGQGRTAAPSERQRQDVAEAAGVPLPPVATPSMSAIPPADLHPAPASRSVAPLNTADAGTAATDIGENAGGDDDDNAEAGENGGEGGGEGGDIAPQRRGRAVLADLARGIAVIEGMAKSLPASPGVYRMLDGRGDVLYVGKARALSRRVIQYTQIARLPNRLKRMVAETRSMEVVSTHTEVEALLLESNYIKRLMPRYNVLLRDDKTFPHIVIRAGHAFPQIGKHRGTEDGVSAYFGPFASAGAVNRTIVALQKAFLLRPCSDAMFASRSRPCLQYQIKRCSAPCVGRVEAEAYAGLVAQATAFLSGKSRDIQDDLAARMQAAAEALDFETAARLRDRIRALSFIQQHQDINVEGIADADVFGVHQAGGQTAIEAFFFRGGRNYGSRVYFPSHDRQLGIGEVLAAFLAQFYDDKPPPPLLLLSDEPDELPLLAEALSQRAGRKVEIAIPQRGPKRKLVEHALTNAREAHGRRMAEGSAQRSLLDGVGRVFGLNTSPERIEVFDNSHVQGKDAYGAMIVAGAEGFIKGAYRKFAIRTPGAAGDDVAMMREVMRRRFARALQEDPERESEDWPDLLLIDGGEPQLGAVMGVLEELGVDDVPVVAIAKGPERDAGRERFFMKGRAPFSLEAKDPVLYFLQRLRDEAHRFVIGAHRAKRAKSVASSALDEVAGIGPARRKALLHHFGSARAVARAGLDDLMKVEGISETVARRVYDYFHGKG